MSTASSSSGLAQGSCTVSLGIRHPVPPLMGRVVAVDNFIITEHGIGATSPPCPPLPPLPPLPQRPPLPPLPPLVGAHEDSCADTLGRAGLVKLVMSPKTSATKTIALVTLFLKFGVTLIMCLAASQH